MKPPQGHHHQASCECFEGGERAEEKEPSMNEIFHRRVLDHLMAGVEDIVGKSGHNSLYHKFDYYNNKYLKPWLLRETPKTRDTSILRVFTKLNMQDAKATAKAFPGSMSRDASWSQFNNNNNNLPSRSPSMTSLYNRRATVAVPNDYDSEMVINMHGVDPVTLKQMPDDLGLHRVLEDSMVPPRSNWAQERRHTLAEIHNPHGPAAQFHQHFPEQEQIRHLFGNGGVYAPPMKEEKGPPHMVNGGAARKVRKNATFSGAHGRLGKKLSDVLEQSQAQENGYQGDEISQIPEVAFSLGSPSPPEPDHGSSSESPLSMSPSLNSPQSPVPDSEAMEMTVRPQSHHTTSGLEPHHSTSSSPSSSPPPPPSDPLHSPDTTQGSSASQQQQQDTNTTTTTTSPSSSSPSPQSSSQSLPSTSSS